MFDSHKNFAEGKVLVAPSPSISGTEITLESGDGEKFPTPPFNLTIWPYGVQPTTENAEIVRVTSITGDVLDIIRTQEDTTAIEIGVGFQCALTITKKIIEDLESQIDTIFGWGDHSDAGYALSVDVYNKTYIDGLVTSLNTALNSRLPLTGGTIQPSSAVNPLVIKGYATGTAFLQRWQKSDGTDLAYLTYQGAAYFNQDNASPTGMSIKGNCIFDTGAANRVGITIKGRASQSSHLQDWTDVNNTVLAHISYDGKIIANNIAAGATVSGTNTGDQDLSGYSLSSHIHPLSYTTQTDNYTILTADLNTAIAMNAATEKTFTLPDTTISDVGKEIMLIKLGVGKLNITAYSGETIADGTTIYNPYATQTWATITLKVAASGVWVIRSIDGDWLTQ